MIYDLYIYIFLERLEPQTRQMEDLMTKDNHHYVVEKLIFLSPGEIFISAKCKFGSKLRNFILVKSNIFTGRKNLYPKN